MSIKPYALTGFPGRMSLVTPSDSEDLNPHAFIRADEPGAVTFIPAGSSTSVTLNVVAGEVIPCKVRRVMDSGTDAITLHAIYQ